MTPARPAARRVGRCAAALVLACAPVAAGCDVQHGGTPNSPSAQSPASASLPFAVPTPTTATPPAAAPDYRQLLLQPEDMMLPNNGYSVPQPATLNPQGIPGAEVMITSNDSTNAVGITIVVLGDAGQAPAELSRAVTGLVTVTATAPPVRVPVGDEALAVTGVTPDGTKSATALLFRRDRALVRIDFYGRIGALTPLATVVDVGQRQSAVVRVGLGAMGPGR